MVDPLQPLFKNSVFTARIIPLASNPVAVKAFVFIAIDD
jgi:hypothetical protein